METMDGMTRVVESESGPNGLVGWFMAASLLYYHCDVSILSDDRYDEIAKLLLANYDSLTHMHAALILKDDLKAGSLYALQPENYPLLVRAMASHLIRGKVLDAMPPEKKLLLYSLEFCPPEYSWDTYIYGGKDKPLTWRKYQTEMTKQWDDMIARGRLTQGQKREFSRLIGIKVAVAPVAPPAPIVRTRSRPAIQPPEPSPVRTRTRPVIQK